jgi:predicted NUDIX family NTP pyrophosphohydrolase
VVTTDKSGRTSAGILLWRRRKGRLEVLLAHQGGPFWVKKDTGHWTIPKGEVEPGEEFVAVGPARVRRRNRTPSAKPSAHRSRRDHTEVGQARARVAVEGDLDPSTASSNTYDLEWPPHSGTVQTFPEIDRVEWFHLDEARRRLKAAQVPFLDRLQALAPDQR